MSDPAPPPRPDPLRIRRVARAVSGTLMAAGGMLLLLRACLEG